MRRLTPVVLATALLAGGCGNGARNELAKTADNVGKIRGGTISFSLLVSPRTKLARNRFGFRLRGPFAFGERPTAHVDYTQIANGHEATATLVLTRSGGYAVANGKRRTLSSSQLAELRDAASAARHGLSVDVSDWVKSAKRCGDHCVEGDLDAAAAISTLLQYTGSKASLTDTEQKEVARATHATYRAVSTGDHLLRSLVVHADLALAAPSQLRAALGALVGATVDLKLAIANPRT